jgi:outer membrane immunogenic protein
VGASIWYKFILIPPGRIEELGEVTMKRLLLSGAAAVMLLAGPAMGADMPMKVPVMISAPAVSSWNGYYIGANVGGSIGRSPTTDGLTFFSPGTGNVRVFNESFNHAPAGWVAGGQIGANWQISPSWVLGIEADWQGTGQKDTAGVFGCGAQTAAFFGAGGLGSNVCLNDEQKLPWFGTVRGRLGYATSALLWYATGGFAHGRVQENLNQGLTAALPGAPPLGVSTTLASFSQNKGGWTIGGGVEAKLWGAWSAKLEYLYVDLGSTTNTFVIPAAAAGNTNTTTNSYSFHDHIIRVGLNYKLR